MTVNTSTLKLVGEDGILYKSLACRQKRDGANKYRASWVLPHIMGGAEDEEYNNYDVQYSNDQRVHRVKDIARCYCTMSAAALSLALW